MRMLVSTVSISRSIIVTRLGQRPGRNLGKTNDGTQWCDMTTRLCILRLTLTDLPAGLMDRSVSQAATTVILGGE